MADKNLFDRYLLALRKTPIDKKTEPMDRSALVAAPQDDDDAEQVDIDEFRMELARRIRTFVDERQAKRAAEAAASGGADAVSASQSESRIPAPGAPQS